MRHRVKKIKFKQGRDANRMLMRKLAINFFTRGKIVTTKAKAKVLKSYLERLVNKTKQKTTANENYLIKKLGKSKLIKRLFEEIGPAVQNKVSGYFKSINLGARLSDGSEMIKLEWALPIVSEEKEIKKTTKKIPYKK